MRDEREFGNDANLLMAAFNKFRQTGAGRRFWNILASSAQMTRLVHQLVEAQLNFTAPRPSFAISVDYSVSFDDRMRSADADWFHTAGRCRFGDYAEESRDLTVEMFDFFGTANREEMRKKLEGIGYRPTSLAESLELLARYPDEMMALMRNGAEDHDRDCHKYLFIVGEPNRNYPEVPILHLSCGYHTQRFAISETDRDIMGRCHESLIPAVKI